MTQLISLALAGTAVIFFFLFFFQMERPPAQHVLESVLKACGGDRKDAQRALDHTSNYSSNPSRWSEAAQAFLVSETQDIAERQALATAMAESLQEEEERKASEKPLTKWSCAELAIRFRSSSILALLPSSENVFDMRCRDQLIEILEFERQSNHWFPGSGTTKFFVDAVKRALPSPPVDLKSTVKRQKGKRVQTPGRATGQTQASESHSKEAIETAVAAIFTEVSEAKEQVYQMPDTENEIPSVFRSNVPEVDHESDVEVLPSDETKSRSEPNIYTLT